MAYLFTYSAYLAISFYILSEYAIAYIVAYFTYSAYCGLFFKYFAYFAYFIQWFMFWVLSFMDRCMCQLLFKEIHVVCSSTLSKFNVSTWLVNKFLCFLPNIIYDLNSIHCVSLISSILANNPPPLLMVQEVVLLAKRVLFKLVLNCCSTEPVTSTVATNAVAVCSLNQASMFLAWKCWTGPDSVGWHIHSSLIKKFYIL